MKTKVCSGTTRDVVAILVLAFVAASLSGCSPTANIDSAWAVKANADTFNVAYPDTFATYWGIRNYVVWPGQRIIVSGTYPYARYMSLHTYDMLGFPFDHIPDYLIVPDAESENPFTNPAGSADPTRRRWTVTVSPDAPKTGGQNGDNLLATPVNGMLWLRVYMPNPGFDEAGGVSLPDVSVQNFEGTITAVPTCPSPAPDQKILDLINLLPTPPQQADDPPVFSRNAETSNLAPNLDVCYLLDFVAYQPGKVIVLRGRAPTTPDTQAGESPASPSQLRYWSFCTNEYQKPYPVSSCAFDHQAALDPSGFYTIVVSTPAERPSNATPDNIITWVDWGSTSVTMLMLMRHMIPAADFTQSAFSVEPGEPASTSMGDYTPVAKFCDASTFETGGATACGF